MFFVYLIKYFNISKHRNEFYTGYTNDPYRRMKEHKSGHTKSLKDKTLIGYAVISSWNIRANAMKEEKRIKKINHLRKERLYETHKWGEL